MSITQPTADQDQAYVQGLRDLADFLAEYPEFVPDHGIEAMSYCMTHNELVGRARAIGGEWQQRTDGRYVKLERRFGSHTIYLFIKAELVGEERTVTRPLKEFHVPDLLAGSES